MLSTSTKLLAARSTASSKHISLSSAPLKYNPATVFGGKSIQTNLSSEVLITRLALCFFASIASYYSLWVIVPIASYAAWLIYKHFRQDPLVEVMHGIAGGKEGYDKLAAMEFPMFRYNAARLKWDGLQSTMYRFKDRGRNGLIVKARSTVPMQGLRGLCNKETLFIFIEKLAPSDYLNNPYCEILKQSLSFFGMRRRVQLINADDFWYKKKPPRCSNTFLAGQSITFA